MLTFFEIKNFKSLKAVSIAMRPFMVLVGPNGSGKTNIVRGLELMGDLLQRGTIDPAVEQGWAEIIRREKKPARGGLSFTVRANLSAMVLSESSRVATGLGKRSQPPEFAAPVEVEASFTLTGSVDSDEMQIDRERFSLRSDRGAFEVSAERNAIAVRPGGDERLWRLVAPQLFRRQAAPGQRPQHEQMEVAFSDYFSERALEQETERRVFRILNLQRFYSLWLTYLVQACQVSRLRLDSSALRSDALFKETSGRDLLGPSGDGLAVAVDRLRGHRTEPGTGFKRVLAALQRVYPRIEDVVPHRLQPGRLTLHFRERGISDALGQANVSDGVLHALALLVTLEGGGVRSQGRSYAAGVLAIEEPENAIHPWSVKAMMERAQDRPTRQIVVTTHSETVVNAVKDPASLFIVENLDGVGTVVTPAHDKEVALDVILRETGQKLGEVWMDGSLGGVPGSEP